MSNSSKAFVSRQRPKGHNRSSVSPIRQQEHVGRTRVDGHGCASNVPLTLELATFVGGYRSGARRGAAAWQRDLEIKILDNRLELVPRLRRGKEIPRIAFRCLQGQKGARPDGTAGIYGNAGNLESVSCRFYRSCQRPNPSLSANLDLLFSCSYRRATHRAARWREQPGRTVRILRAPWHAQRLLRDISARLTVRRSLRYRIQRSVPLTSLGLPFQCPLRRLFPQTSPYW
jgi:hypothetical protein